MRHDGKLRISETHTVTVAMRCDSCGGNVTAHQKNDILYVEPCPVCFAALQGRPFEMPHDFTMSQIIMKPYSMSIRGSVFNKDWGHSVPSDMCMRWYERTLYFYEESTGVHSYQKLLANAINLAMSIPEPR